MNTRKERVDTEVRNDIEAEIKGMEKIHKSWEKRSDKDCGEYKKQK
jgi:hypothetical protein